MRNECEDVYTRGMVRVLHVTYSNFYSTLLGIFLSIREKRNSGAACKSEPRLLLLRATELRPPSLLGGSDIHFSAERRLFRLFTLVPVACTCR